MPMGYGANFAETVDHKLVKKLCPKELAKLEDVLKQDEEINDLEGLAQNIAWGETLGEDIELALDSLYKAFEKKTGLMLDIGFHNQNDDGDCYDEVNGMFWGVDNVYEKTKAAKKFEKAGHKIERKFFVRFG